MADVEVTLAAHCHAVARSRAVCAQALAYARPTSMSFGLLAPVRIQQAAINTEAFDAACPNGTVALVHGTSRFDKQWPLDHWRSLGQRLNASGYAVALPHGSDAEQRTAEQIAQGVAHAEVWPRFELDALTDNLATCAGVIGVDSGLSHIAVALDLPHVQIYKFDTAWRTGPLERAHQCSVFAQPTPAVDAVWAAWLAVRDVPSVGAGPAWVPVSFAMRVDDQEAAR